MRAPLSLTTPRSIHKPNQNFCAPSGRMSRASAIMEGVKNAKESSMQI